MTTTERYNIKSFAILPRVIGDKIVWFKFFLCDLILVDGIYEYRNFRTLT